MEVNKLKELFFEWEQKSQQYDYDINQAIIEKKSVYEQIERWLTSYLTFLSTTKNGVPKHATILFKEWTQKPPIILKENNAEQYLKYINYSMQVFTSIAFTLGILKFHKEGNYVEILDESEEAIIGIKKIKTK